MQAQCGAKNIQSWETLTILSLEMVLVHNILTEIAGLVILSLEQLRYLEMVGIK